MLFNVKTVPWFTSKQERAIKRHPLNDRNVDGISEETVHSIVQTGVMPGVSSRPLMVATSNPELFLAIGSGKRSDCFYVACERYPQSPQVKLRMECGSEECVVLHEATPTDVLRYLVVCHSEFHRGSASTYIQACKWGAQIST